MDWNSARLPAEWECQSAIWFTWPEPAKHWDGRPMSKQWAQIVATITPTQTVRINAARMQHDAILSALNESKADLNSVELFDHPSDDVWCRDHGALFVKDASGTVAATDWTFNGWGGAFEPIEKDQLIASQMVQSQKIACRSYSDVLEGGAIEINEQGILLTTEAVLLNKNRNPHLDRIAVEHILKTRLGAHEVVWLKDGIIGDDTGGHIDDIARFVDNETILIASDPEGENNARLAQNRAILSEWGRAELIDLPMPQACRIDHWRLSSLPASYANFLITNQLVLVPTFRQPKSDDRALSIIRQCFPKRTIIGIDCLELIMEGGALHCISMQQPKKCH